MLAVLAEQGHEMGRPYAALLRDGIYELRVHYGHVNYRMLYFFVDDPYPSAVVVSHGLTKEARVPPGEIEAAIKRRELVRLDWEAHTYDQRCIGDSGS
jgi:hypothetical protein